MGYLDCVGDLDKLYYDCERGFDVNAPQGMALIAEIRRLQDLVGWLQDHNRPILEGGLYVGTVKFVRAGGNPGLAWRVQPDFESVEYGYLPNDGDRLCAVPIKAPKPEE